MRGLTWLVEKTVGAVRPVRMGGKRGTGLCRPFHVGIRKHTMSNDRFDHLFIEPSSFDASLSFYRDALGWKVMFSWGEKGEPRGASLSSGAMSIVLAEPHPSEDKSKSHGINGNRPTAHLIVENVNQRYAELANAGVALSPPEPTHWGTRWFVAKDPDGNLIAFEQKTDA